MKAAEHTVADLVDRLASAEDDLRPTLVHVDAEGLIQRSMREDADRNLVPDAAALAFAMLVRALQSDLPVSITPTQCHAFARVYIALEQPQPRNALRRFARLVAELAHAYAISRPDHAVSMTAHALETMQEHDALSQQQSGMCRAHAYHAHALLRRSWASRAPEMRAIQQLESAKRVGFFEYADQAVYEQVESSFDLVRGHLDAAIGRLNTWSARHAKIARLHKASVIHQRSRYYLLDGQDAEAERAARQVSQLIRPHRVHLPAFDHEVRRIGVAAHFSRMYISRQIDADETIYTSGAHSSAYRRAGVLMQVASSSKHLEWRWTCIRRAVELYREADRPLEAVAAFTLLPRMLAAYDPIGVDLSRFADNELQQFLADLTAPAGGRTPANDDSKDVH
ncbi:MAG: hypothetical protein AAF968_00240 [Pseudomonadota bacterium]